MDQEVNQQMTGQGAHPEIQIESVVPPGEEKAPVTINELLIQMTNDSCSDLHLRAGIAPRYRRYGSLVPMPGRPVLSGEMVRQVFLPLLSQSMLAAYKERRSIDFSHSVPGVGRYRVNLYIQQGQMSGAFRLIPEVVPTLEELRAPSMLEKFAQEKRGLLLVTGPTGSGKSTTLAATINRINETRKEHIITIEDPIEYVHQCKQCMVNQREVLKDTPSYEQGLKDSLREDPDIILIGELRDLETMQIALRAAETGHLVFATLHTSSAPSAIDRIVDVFPEGQKSEVRTMLAGSLIGVVTQALLPRADGEGRVAAHEIMVVNNPVKAMIRAGTTANLRGELQTSTGEGMQTLDRSMVSLIAKGLLSEEEGLDNCQSEKEFIQLLNRVKSGQNIVVPGIIGETDDQAESL
jgi:twitching motility protein PilT